MSDIFDRLPVLVIREVNGLVGYGLVYLATPYSKRATDDGGAFCPYGAASAADEATVYAAALAARGVTAISPIVMAHRMCEDGAAGLDPLDAAFWTRWCAPLLRACRAVVVPPIRGWRESDGVAHEVREARARGIPVFLAGPLR